MSLTWVRTLMAGNCLNALIALTSKPSSSWLRRNQLNVTSDVNQDDQGIILSSFARIRGKVAVSSPLPTSTPRPTSSCLREPSRKEKMSRALSFSSIYSRILSLFVFLLSFLPASHASEWIQYPPNGYATMTYYTLPTGFIAACGCTPNSTYYPTAALSQMAYGSSTSYGPACGQCFNLTLVDAFTANPRFYPNVTSSVVVKITDLCPLSTKGWCNATTSRPNA